MSDAESPNNKKSSDGFEIKIEINKEVAEGIYSNLVIINHSSSEFILDFTQILPGIEAAQVKSRIIMTSSHAKALLLALQDNINKFEKSFGNIPTQPSGKGGNFLGGNSNFHLN